ncbi:MAG: ATP-binding protein [Beijerinckiaceae bacterium]
MYVPLPKDQSIATRLFLSAAAWSTILLLIAGIFLVTVYRRNSERSFDARLGLYLSSLVADLAVGDDNQLNEPGRLGDPQFDLAQSGWYWQVTRLTPAPPQIRQSLSLSGVRLPWPAAGRAEPQASPQRLYYIDGPDGRRLRVLERVIDIGATGTFLIQIAATNEAVEEQIWNFKLALVVTFVLLSLALVGTTALQVRYGLKPLRRLQGEVATIRQGRGEKIEGQFPQDLAPLAEELNLLIASNREVVERARTQVGNLAHALKTPLSVITNEADREKSTFSAKVREQTQIMRDQVTYYLDRARAAARSTVVGSVLDIDGPLDALIRTFEKIYRDRRVKFRRNGLEKLRFRGEKQDFEEMAGNLLDNAGKWAKSRIEIDIQSKKLSEGEFMEIVIDDDGPGLPAGLRADALTRGRRLDETKPGSGLGLSIVSDLAATYGGLLALEDSPLGGLRVRLTLPSV